MYWISLASLPALRDASRHGQNGTGGVVLLRSLQSKRSVSKTISRIAIFAAKITIDSFVKGLYDAWASPAAGAFA